MITQHGLVNYLQWATATYAGGDGRGAPVHSTIAFDLTVTERVLPLLRGRDGPRSSPRTTASSARRRHPLGGTFRRHHDHAGASRTARCDAPARGCRGGGARAGHRRRGAAGELLDGSGGRTRRDAPDQRVRPDRNGGRLLRLRRACRGGAGTAASRSAGRSPTRRLYVLDRRPAARAGRRAGRAVHRRRRRRPRLSGPARSDGRAVRARPVQRQPGRAPVPHRRPGALSPRRHARVSRAGPTTRSRSAATASSSARSRRCCAAPGGATTRLCWRARSPGDDGWSPTSCQGRTVAASAPRPSTARWRSGRRCTKTPTVAPRQSMMPASNSRAGTAATPAKPIPAEEMREWVERTCDRILSLKPTRVLEIGCGTGLLLFRIAPHVSRYCGLDFSRPVIDKVEREVARRGLADRVSLLHRTADDLSGVEPGAYDVVILNSVAQYFPGADYLARVLEGAASALAPGGSSSSATCATCGSSMRITRRCSWIGRRPGCRAPTCSDRCGGGLPRKKNFSSRRRSFTRSVDPRAWEACGRCSSAARPATS